MDDDKKEDQEDLKTRKGKLQGKDFVPHKLCSISMLASSLSHAM